MTNYEKIIKDMSVDRFATMLIKTAICPFTHSCHDCDFDGPLICELSKLTEKEMVEWLESEVVE